MTHKSYKFRFYPNLEQENHLAREFGCARFVYNKSLGLIKDAWFEENKNISYSDVSKMLAQWKKEEDMIWLNDVSSVTLQQSLRDLQTAFKNFWGKTSKYPKFKSRRNKMSVRYVKSGFYISNNDFYLAKIKSPLNIKFDRNLDLSLIRSVTVSKDKANRYFISMLVEENIEKLDTKENSIGLDWGVASIFTTDTGVKYPNPKLGQKFESRIIKAHKDLSRKVPGSKNWEKSRLKLAKLYGNLTDARKDFNHKLTTQIVRENQTIICESLTVISMVKNSKKNQLNKNIMDTTPGELMEQLRYKSEWYGRNFVMIDRFFPSSQMCSNCGRVDGKKDLSIRKWSCICGSIHDRDINAAKNIKEAGLALLACGDQDQF